MLAVDSRVEGAYASDRHSGQTDGRRDVSFAERVDESQRRQHGVTAAIMVDVVGALRPCVSL